MSATEYPSFVLRAPSRSVLPARARPAGRLETIAIAVGICLPVPLLAATGLSVPLPNVVERIAASLVPWAEPVAFVQGSSGTIVPTVAETTAAGVSPQRVQGTLASTAASARRAAERAAAAPGTARPLERRPESRPVATGGGTIDEPASSASTNPVAPDATGSPGEVDRSGTATPAAGGDAPAPAPRAEMDPTAPPRSDPGPSTPPAAPVPDQSTPVTVPVLPAEVLPQAPATVDKVVDEVATVVADPVVTVVADPIGTVGGAVKTPLPPGLGG